MSQAQNWPRYIDFFQLPSHSSLTLASPISTIPLRTPIPKIRKNSRDDPPPTSTQLSPMPARRAPPAAALGLADASPFPMSSTVPLTRALACGRRLGRSKVTGENIRLILSLGEEIDIPDGDAPIMRFAYECECECGKGKGREGVRCSTDQQINRDTGLEQSPTKCWRFSKQNVKAGMQQGGVCTHLNDPDWGSTIEHLVFLPTYEVIYLDASSAGHRVLQLRHVPILLIHLEEGGVGTATPETGFHAHDGTADKTNNEPRNCA